MQKQTLAYFDCFSGISGDMTLGAMIALGVPTAWLKDAIGRLPLAGFDLTVETLQRNGIRASRVQVVVEEGAPPRDYAVIRDLIGAGRLTRTVRDRSLEAFDRIAGAEAGIHGCEKEKVHFHEVGGVDAIVDIVGTMLCVDYLGIETVVSSPLPLGRGFVSCRHGLLPLPAPATVAILKGLPIYGTDEARELVTPTGAAIVATLAESFGPLPDMCIEKCGYGAGEREGGTMPNLLRILTGRPGSTDGLLEQDTVCVLETAIDDMNPEIFGYLMERLFEDGALDVNWIPVQMKKNRPGTLVQVVCPLDRRDFVIRRILAETTSLGVRYRTEQRRKLHREAAVVTTEFGDLTVKKVVDLDGNVRLVPEYEDCKRIARERNIPIQKVYDALRRQGGVSEKKL